MVIKIGTDCSGIEAPLQALKQMDIPYQHVWSCEIDKHAEKSILANYNPQKMYHDITKRKHASLPDVDIYVCGFPCQPFSLMGNKTGTEDSRSNIMYQCIKVIKKKLPKVFILENVKNFKFIEKGKPFNYLLKELKGIKNENKQIAYNVYCDILNTKDYSIPQNRERIFFIGIRKDIQKAEYTTPDKLPLRNLDDFIIDKTIHENTKNFKSINTKLKKINYQKNYIFPNSNYVNPLENLCPTLSTRCDMFFHSTYNRYLTTTECLLLQGFLPDFIQNVSKTQMYKQIGNSMSVNVLRCLFLKIFSITELL